MTRRRAPTFTAAQTLAMMRAQAITPEAQARGDALMRGEKRVPITVELAPAEPPSDWVRDLAAAAAEHHEIAKAARARRRAHPPPAQGTKARTSTPGASEAQVLSAVLAFLRRHPGVARVWRQNTGAMEGAGGQFVRFGFEGQPDICGFMRDGRALYVEVKREKGGRVSEAQAAFIDAARAAGCVAGVARSVEDARGILEGRG